MNTADVGDQSRMATRGCFEGEIPSAANMSTAQRVPDRTASFSVPPNTAVRFFLPPTGRGASTATPITKAKVV